MARQKIEPEAVMDWLRENHPELHKTAEPDRNWIWLCCGESLKGDEPEKVAIRKSIGEFGFRFARNGHPMPSGNVGIWSHSCLVPKKFERKGRIQSQSKPKSKSQCHNKPTGAKCDTGSRRIDPFEIQPNAYAHLAEQQVDSDLAAGVAFFNS